MAKSSDKKDKSSHKTKLNTNMLQSILALTVLAGLAFEGIRSLLESTPEAIQVGMAALLVVMLVSFATKR